jgi:metal-responsive CopG/Arc/MetJ family transcriptional regulator
MIRTQVYLPEQLYKSIKLQARLEKKPAAQIIRDVLEEGIEAKKPTQTLGEALLGLAELGKKLNLSGPTDLSTNIDKYLYEEWDQK